MRLNTLVVWLALCGAVFGMAACGDGSGGGDADVDTECLDAPEPETCDDAHGDTGCCVGSVLYFWDFDSAIGLDCSDENDPGCTCGWTGETDGWYDCGGDGADPDHPGAMCCGGSNPYGGC
ncbi:MAG: hypothetical protein M0R80_31225 [Proteobacteria bacterium]|jgi:hypothetical protein|nr:hypothetical protein [Pseudomonadota bacterium]